MRSPDQWQAMESPMIDLHCHILPQVDDGATSVPSALEMLKIAAADGIERVVATPHIPTPGGVVWSPEELLDRIAVLNSLATTAGIPVEVIPGSEILLEPDVDRRLARGELLTINGTPYALFELPLVGEWPTYVRSTIYEIQIAGFIPILAHVERYPGVQRDPGLLEQLIATGVLLQVNAESILRSPDDRVGRTAARLLRSRMVHIVASDAHSPDSRAPRIRSAIDRVTELAGSDYANWITSVSECVILGETVHAPDPISVARVRWWSRLWSRSPA